MYWWAVSISPLYNPAIPALLINHQPIIYHHHTPRLSGVQNAQSVIHSSVSQSISHPSNQSTTAEAFPTNQSDGVVWVMKRKRQILWKTVESRPTYHPTLTHFMAPLTFLSPLACRSSLPAPTVQTLDSSFHSEETASSRDKSSRLHFTLLLSTLKGGHRIFMFCNPAFLPKNKGFDALAVWKNV